MKFVRTCVSLCTLALASPVSAEIPVPGPVPECGGIRIDPPSSRPEPWQPRSVAREDSGLCSEYIYGGWKNTMLLYFGEGAVEHRDTIELAVKKWNDALMGFSREPVIEFAGQRPENYSLSGDFWRSSDDESHPLAQDGQSVIYFKGRAVESSPGGFARLRTDGENSMVESDIYINTTDWEEYGPFLFRAQEIFRMGDRTVYAAVDSVYLVILHEIGHALGLKHVPVSGNVMSYNYLPYMQDLWSVPVTVEFFKQAEYIESVGEAFSRGALSEFLWQGPEDLSTYQYRPDPSLLERIMLSHFTYTAGLGEQDRMSLLCAYEFSDWNH